MTWETFAKKYEGKTIKATLRVRKNSIFTRSVYGKVTSFKDYHATMRDGRYCIVEHKSFYLLDKGETAHLIEWNQVPLITKIEIVD